mmetsp:Transcript_19534/g.59091  ORF Transcript_19534/g.59091 Transcript_19534/m.59091 type:complete len:232 (+) Transcript_19534:1728-2423(+)
MRTKSVLSASPRSAACYCYPAATSPSAGRASRRSTSAPSAALPSTATASSRTRTRSRTAPQTRKRTKAPTTCTEIMVDSYRTCKKGAPPRVARVPSCTGQEQWCAHKEPIASISTLTNLERRRPRLLEDPKHLIVDEPIRRQDIPRLRRVVRPVEVADAAAGLGDDDLAGRDVPRVQIEAEVAREAAAGDPGQHHRCRREHAEPAHLLRFSGLALGLHYRERLWLLVSNEG